MNVRHNNKQRSSAIKNEHLEPIFKIVLPKLVSVNVPHWVYGGLGYAAMVGQFYRKNSDVDLFVLDNDFDKTGEILDAICQENGWRTCKPSIRSGRLKIELFIQEKERLSVISVCETGESVKFTFHEGSKEYPFDGLRPVERNLTGYRFRTPQDGLLKELLRGYLASKEKYPDRIKRMKDCRRVLTSDECRKYFPSDKTSVKDA